MIYITAPSCSSLNGKHDLVDAESPWYGKCIHCGTRFALVAEPVLKELDIKLVKRPLIKQ